MTWFLRLFRRPRKPTLWEAAGFPAPVVAVTDEQRARVGALLADAASMMIASGVTMSPEWWCALDPIERTALWAAAKSLSDNETIRGAFAASRARILARESRHAS